MHTPASLASDPRFTNNVASSIATVVDVRPSNVNITKVEVVSLRLGEALQSQLEGPSRPSGPRVNIEYTLTTDSATEMTRVREILADDAVFSTSVTGLISEKLSEWLGALVITTVVPILSPLMTMLNGTTATKEDAKSEEE